MSKCCNSLAKSLPNVSIPGGKQSDLVSFSGNATLTRQGVKITVLFTIWLSILGKLLYSWFSSIFHVNTIIYRTSKPHSNRPRETVSGSCFKVYLTVLWSSICWAEITQARSDRHQSVGHGMRWYSLTVEEKAPLQADLCDVKWKWNF